MAPISHKRMKPSVRSGVAFAALVATLLISGCAYEGRFNDPVARRVTWFDLISGGDIKRACKPESAFAARFVRYANRLKEVRILDVTPEAEGYRLTSRMLPGDGDISKNFPLPNPFAPWTPVEETVSLSAGDVSSLKGDLDADRKTSQVDGQAIYPSIGHFWIASVCDNGRFRIDSWGYPEIDIESLKFAKDLKGLDPIVPGIPAPDPSDPVTVKDFIRASGGSHIETGFLYDLKVTQDGVSFARIYDAPGTDRGRPKKK